MSAQIRHDVAGPCGQAEVADLMLVAILCEGHALVEGVPGVGKTLTIKTLSRLLGFAFQRVQCTADLMPADIIGTNVVTLATGGFQFHQGPVFTDLLLVDEINRMPPRTQAALLECMEERQVTVDGVAYALAAFFSVFATQNPIEFEGTYPLPEAQLDRFLLKIRLDYPDHTRQEKRPSSAATTRASTLLGGGARPRPARPAAAGACAADVAGVQVEARCSVIRGDRTPDTRLAGNALGISPRARFT